MNEQTQKYLRIGAYVLCVIAVAAVVWLLFRDIRADSEPANRVNDRLEDTQREQQAAGEAIDRAIDRAADSTDTAGRIKDGIEHSQDSTDRAADATDRAETAIDAASDSVDRAAAESDECQKLNSSSESIFNRYESGN